MTARPKPGDRVRVSVEGTWQHGPWIVDDQDCSWFLSRDGITYPLVGTVHVEVLKPPLYVNSDTTKPQQGDVVANGHGTLYMYGFRGGVDGGMDPVWRDRAGAEWGTDQLYRPLTLLVHNGELVRW